MAIADDGYADLRCIRSPGTQHRKSGKLAPLRARHENVNRRLKQFNLLSVTFRHSIDRHSSFTWALLNVINLMLQEEPLFLCIRTTKLYVASPSKETVNLE